MKSPRHPSLSPHLPIILSLAVTLSVGTTRSARGQQYEQTEANSQVQSSSQVQEGPQSQAQAKEPLAGDSQPPVVAAVVVVPPGAPARSPAALIEDLVEVVVHKQLPAPGTSQGVKQPLTPNPSQTPADDGELHRNKSKPYQHVIPDVININYRPARAAAQIYMGHGSEDDSAKQLDQAKFRDEITVLVTSIMLDMATALGEQPDKHQLQGDTIAITMDKLSQLVGQQEAIWAFDRMQKFSRSNLSESGKIGDLEIPVKFKETWDVLGQQALAGQIFARAMARDQQAGNFKARLGVHENPPNPLEQTLSLLSMIPEVVATAALVGDQVLEMSNGGTREKRLTEVLSLGLQLDSRQAALSRQSYLAASSINAGKLSSNRVLSAFASALALRLMGQ